MALTLYDLDPRTRELMLAEIELDEGSKGLYISRYLNNGGQNSWSSLLRQAATSGTPASLEAELKQRRCFREKAERRTPSGGVTMAAVPVTAAMTLAEGQFGMYYIRALCVRALEEKRQLIVYRAKAVDRPRPESERLIGQHLDPQYTLDSLRSTMGVEPPTGIPMPNSGLSVHLE